jgi:hypothetical protein
MAGTLSAEDAQFFADESCRQVLGEMILPELEYSMIIYPHRMRAAVMTLFGLFAGMIIDNYKTKKEREDACLDMSVHRHDYHTAAKPFFKKFTYECFQLLKTFPINGGSYQSFMVCANAAAAVGMVTLSLEAQDAAKAAALNYARKPVTVAA